MTHAKWLVVAMFGAVIIIGTAMLLDEQREFERALDDLRIEQMALVTAVGADFEARLSRTSTPAENELTPSHVGSMIGRLLGGATELNQPHSRLLLVIAPGVEQLFRTDGTQVQSSPLRAAHRAQVTSLVIPRKHALDLGLPERLAVAGLRRVVVGNQVWGVIVVASAERLRARERHSEYRFLLGLVVVTVLVTGFGGLALRDQRRKLQVARELEVAALQRESERLLNKADKMATLAALSSGIAHQIATPLGTIMARVEQVLPAVASEPKAMVALEVVAEQVARIQRIITGVLDLARGNRPTLVTTRPEAIVQSALALVQHRLKESGIKTDLRIEDGLDAIACDPPMLEQALVNILLNACEASGRHATIRVVLEHAGRAVRFVVEDEGEGISEETAMRAREPFFTTKSKSRGTGLGLAIAQEVVSNHGGKLSLVRVDSPPGTRAAIEMPTV